MMVMKKRQIVKTNHVTRIVKVIGYLIHPVDPKILIIITIEP
tara:strand:- start:58 stop:183 length:126 start_codon:yes stop_codon:yes gene_type:complete